MFLETGFSSCSQVMRMMLPLRRREQRVDTACVIARGYADAVPQWLLSRRVFVVLKLSVADASHVL